MIPKGKLLALVLAFAAVGGLAATGAFTSVEADRTAEVTVAGDANTLLALEPNANDSSDANTFVTSSTSDSTLSIDLSNNAINTNATTDAGAIINVTNNGEDQIGLTVEPTGVDSDSEIEFYAVGSDGTSNADFTPVSNAISDRSSLLGNQAIITDDQANGTALQIDPGTTEQVGLAIDVGDVSVSGNTTILDGVTFLADDDDTGDIDP